MEAELRTRIARLTIGGGLLIVTTGACVAEVGVSAGEVADGLAVAFLALGVGVPMMLFGTSFGRAARRELARSLVREPLARETVAAPTTKAPSEVATEVFPGGGFDIPLFTEPSLELDIVVDDTDMPAAEEWVVVHARGALFGRAEIGAA